MTTVLTLSKKKPSSGLSNEQKTFNRLKNQIERLQRDIKSSSKMMEEIFKVFNEILVPIKQHEEQLHIQYVKLVFTHYENQKLSKNNKKILKNFILENINEILGESDPFNPDKEICAILKKLEGVDFKKELFSEFIGLKDNLEDLVKKQGLDIDLSDLSEFEDIKDFEFNLFEKLQKAKEKLNIDDFVTKTKPKPKTKKQIEKENKIQEIENLEKKGLSTIYKQLAKNIHPDLEQDPSKKIVKESLMKRLTHAYETQDLHAILSLEIESRNFSGNDLLAPSTQSTEQLKLLNSLLKKQIENLKKELEAVCMHPRFFAMHQYISKDLLSTFSNIKYDIDTLKKIIHNYKINIEKLLRDDPLPALKAIISNQKLNYELETLFF